METESGKIITNESFTDLVVSNFYKQPVETRSYIDSVLEVCEELGIDIEDSKSYMTKALIESLSAEASKKFLVKERITTLELF